MVHNIENQVTADFLQLCTKAHTLKHTIRTMQRYHTIAYASHENGQPCKCKVIWYISDHWSAGRLGSSYQPDNDSTAYQSIIAGRQNIT